MHMKGIMEIMDDVMESKSRGANIREQILFLFLLLFLLLLLHVA